MAPSQTAPTVAVVARLGRTRVLVLAAALAGCAGTPGPAPTPAAAAKKAPAGRALVGPPADALPGVDLADLSPEQQKLLAEWSLEEFCYGGCPHTLSQCLREHSGCRHAPRMARLAARLVKAGVSRAELSKLVHGYYGSFDAVKRAKLDVAEFGPSKGAGKIAIVEFSDYTCPYCQLFHPALERYASERAGRVRIYFKPYPIESHPGAQELAQASEWARSAGIFEKMHDALFSSPHTAPEELPGVAASLGADGAALEKALAAGTFKAKVAASQAEARAAGIKGTPSLFFEGRLLAIPDFSDWFLEFTLEDEEEWQANRGWLRD